MVDNKNYQVVMPKLGLTMAEASVVEWKCENGSWVDKDAELFSLESDKSVLEIEAPAAGYVEFLVDAGVRVPVHTPIAVLHKEPWQGKSAGQTSSEDSSTSPLVQNASTDAVEPLRASPKARKLARQHGLDIKTLADAGSGLRGMVVSSDVQSAMKEQPRIERVLATPLARKVAAVQGVNLKEVVPSARNGVIHRLDVEKVIQQQKAAETISGDSTVDLPLSGLRKVIAERMVTGWRERPQVTLVSEVDASHLVDTRQQIFDESGLKLSFNAFFIKAAARALRDLPYINVQLSERGCAQMTEVNIGIAVDTERGLIVPIIRQADGKNLVQIQKELKELGQATLEGRIKPDQMVGGTFTITNLGAYGIDTFTPIINPPETAILGVGKIAPRPVVFENQIVIRQTVTLSLAFDHRLVDGAPAARFLQRLSQLLERPCVLSAELGSEE